MFTQQTLRRLATDKVFDRGQELYAAGAVHKLSRSAPTRFGARVKGSYSYHVAVWAGRGGEVEFSCDCPYDFEGICKHSVALGLAVLDAYGSSFGTATTAGPAAETSASGSPAAALAAAWAARPDAEKLRFLELALGKNEDLARQFLAYGGAAAAPAMARPAPDFDPLANLTEEITEALGGLDFGEDFWENNPEAAYDDSGEMLAEAGYDEVREALAPFVAALLRLARAGQLTAALRYWATANAAIFQVEEPAADEYGVFGDYGENALHLWHEALQAAGWPENLTAAVLPPAELKAALKWLGKHLTDPPARWPDFEASWRPLLLALAADPAAAPLLPAALEKANLSPDTLARLALQTARTLPDDAAWVRAAETLLPTDVNVAAQLLNYYTSQADRPALRRTAATAFTTWPDRFGGEVLRLFTPQEAPDLYRAALRHRALANASMPDFERLRPLLDAAEVAGFVKAAVKQANARSGSVAFAAGLLTREGDTDALRKFVLGLEWLNVSPSGDVETALRLLAAADPTPLMLDMETRLPAYLTGRAGARRGGVLYERLARWLSAAHAATPRLHEPARRLALQLRADFPTLYGLRDALRSVGLLDVTVVSGGRGGRGGGR